MKIRSIIILVFFMFVIQGLAIEPVAKIIKQKDVPVELRSYKIKYYEGSRYVTQRIRHSIKYKNISEKTIIAIQVGFVSFDIWNKFLDRTNGLAMEDIAPGVIKKGTWIARAYSDFSFHSGFAFVSKVRFSDGIFWMADLESIVEEMKKIYADFDIKKLKKKTESK